MLGEWVIVTPKRTDRLIQESTAKCPFCPDSTATSADWKVLTLDTELPSLDPTIGVMPLDENFVMEAPAYGFCKIIVLSPKHDEQIEWMGDNQLERVFREYLAVFKELDKQKGIQYVYEFENRGKTIGVGLNHPHGEVYALPFIPPRIKQELVQFQKWWDENEKCLGCQIVKNELKAVTSRVILETNHYVSFVPHSARLPYEVHIYPKEHVTSLVDIEDRLLELGKVVQDIVKRYSKVFDEVAYVMAFHTRPSVGEYPYWHFHIELYPPWRNRSQLKYQAGVETGVGVYTNDTLPEEIAKELREAI
jgi:UDPglucose--hexose-1-phosphate uridylyltransferase